MTLQEIIDQTRYKLGNFEVPWLWVDKELVLYANEAINQVCRDVSAIQDTTTTDVCECVVSQSGLGSYSLHQSIIYVREAKLLVEEALALTTLPAEAWVVGDTLTGTTSGTTSTVKEVISTTIYIITGRNGQYTKGETITNGTYPANQTVSGPTIKPYISKPLQKLTLHEFNQYVYQQQDMTFGEPRYYALDYDNGILHIDPTPDATYIVHLDVYRYPLRAFTTTTALSAQVPEIPTKYHAALIDSICAQAYLKNGENTYDNKKSANHLMLFQKFIRDAKIKNNRYDYSGDQSVTIHGAFI